jgi:hypothetical protein
MLLRTLLMLKKEDYPPQLHARLAEARSIATSNGVSIESLDSLTDEEVEELVSIVSDVLGLA